jgi:thioredoxin domain-containing protein 5
MEGAWKELAKSLADKKNIRIARVDCTQNESLCKGQDIQGYPSLFIYKDGSKMSEFLDSRETEKLTNFIKLFLPHDEL